MNAPAVLELPLDAALLKVLSSESRREILRLLRERRMTGAELAGRLDLGKPAVAEHLKKLQDAELIERFDDPERRWVYYNLSSRGRGILEPQRVRFYLVMAVAALALMVGVALALGLVVLMQGHVGAGALGTDPADGGMQLGGANSPENLPGMAVPDVTVQNGPGPVDPATQPSSGGPAGDAVITGAAREADPVGNFTVPRPNQSITLILDDRNAIGPLYANTAGAEETLVLVYRAQDIDSLNQTVRLHFLSLNASELAEANLTEAVKSAATVPGVGLLLQVPDDTLIASQEGATLSIQSELSANAPVEPATLAGPSQTDAAVDPAPASQAPPADEGNESGQAPGLAPTAQDAPEGTDGSPGSTPVIVGEGTAGLAPAGSLDLPGAGAVDPSLGTPAGAQGAQQDAAAAQGMPAKTADAPVAPLVSTGKAAPIPLVAILAAALMVSIYVPNRRN